MLISHIVAMTKNKLIGKANKLPWHLPADMEYFKEKTIGHVVIMGRKNYEAEGKPLSQRTNIIVTSKANYHAPNCIIVNNMEEAINKAGSIEKDEIFIVGGGEIYKQTMNIINKLYLTVIDLEMDGDVFYPDIDLNSWKMISKNKYQKDKENPYDHTYFVYERKP